MANNWTFIHFNSELSIFFSINIVKKIYFFCRVRKQVVNVPSFIVRLDSQKHIDFSLKSPFGGGRPGRVKRKSQRKGAAGASAGDEEDDE